MAAVNTESFPRQVVADASRASLEPSAGIVVREVRRVEAVPLLTEREPSKPREGMSRAMPRYVGTDGDVVAFVAERGGVFEGPVAMVWCACEAGRSTVTVHHVRPAGVPDAVMTRLFARLREAVASRGVRWLRWHLGREDFPLLSAIRAAVGVPVVHREGSNIVAEVAATKRWRTR